MGIDPSLIAWANRHHGLLTFGRWQLAGLSRSAWFRALGSGHLLACRSGVARLPGAPATDLSTIAAAVWTVGGDAVASHRSTARLWGAPTSGCDPVDLTTSRRGRGTMLDGIALHRPRDLVDLRAVTRAGIATCNPLRCLVDLGAVAPAEVAATLESFLISGFVSFRAASAALGRHRARGRHGVTALADALADLPLGSKPPDSVLETVFGRLLDDHNQHGWTFHHRVAGYEVDFAFVEARLAIEVDGWDVHGRREQFERDRQRDVELATIGWLVLRFTWLQVTRRRAWVAGQVCAALAHRR